MFSIFSKSKKFDKEIALNLLSNFQAYHQFALTKEKEQILSLIDSSSEDVRAFQTFFLVEVLMGYSSFYSNKERLLFEFSNKSPENFCSQVKILYQNHAFETFDSTIQSIAKQFPKSSFSKALMKGKLEGIASGLEESYIKRITFAANTYSDPELLGLGPLTLQESICAEVVSGCDIKS